MPTQYFEVDVPIESEVFQLTYRIILQVAPELGLEQPRVRFCRPSWELSPSEKRGRPSVVWGQDGGMALAQVDSTINYDPELGWSSGRPEFWLNLTHPGPDIVLHEMRHLWQLRHGWGHDDKERAEADAYAWTAERMKTLDGPWVEAVRHVPNRAEKRRLQAMARRRH